MKKTSIVLGLGFGDEGKGLTTSYLSSFTKNPLVVRFSGGHNAGHTVVYKNQRHVFSTFGSGSLQGVPTYWSKYCTFNPITVVNEYEGLKKLGITPTLFVDPLCPVTTLYDVLANQEHELKHAHGSVGVGFGKTLERHDNHFKLHVQDLFYPTVLKTKLNLIKRYYGFEWDNTFATVFPERVTKIREAEIEMLKAMKKVADIITLSCKHVMDGFDHIIFEGSQGILLDQDFGFFPNVTRSNTTAKNAMEIIKQFDLPVPDIYYITRSYQTRHGNGFMTNEDNPPKLVNHEDETNVADEWQGNFRTGLLDIDLLNYALQSDNYYTDGCKKNLVVTCLDQTGNKFKATLQGSEFTLGVDELESLLDPKFDKVITSASPDSDQYITVYPKTSKTIKELIHQ